MRKLKRLALTAVLSIMALPMMADGDTLFIYSPDPRSGLHVAVHEADGWHDLGQLCGSDYGPWGAEKRMYHPSLCRADDGTWRLVFQVNDHSPVLAAAYSKDLVTWRPQDYPRVTTATCLQPLVFPSEDGFLIRFKSDQGMRALIASYDFRHFSDDFPMAVYDLNPWRRDAVEVDGKRMEGQMHAVTSAEVSRLRDHFRWQAEDNRLNGERMHDDAQNLKLPAVVTADLTVYPMEEKQISDKLIGIFFEDISYAADGGLYAELVQNRDFEYNSKDRREWTASTAWHSPAPIKIDEAEPLHPNNPHYALVTNDTLWNEGWDGMAVNKGQKYEFSVFVRGKKTIAVKLLSADGQVIGSAKVKAKGKAWKRYAAVLTATATDVKARLLLLPQGKNEVAIDMVSLFPQETFKGRKNGLRKDLAETIAALHPKFVRFPGGCMSHGQGLENIYHWQHTVGPLESRVPDFNIWHYHQTRGLGFFEYFQFCEDIGAEPLPVLAAGVPCQNSGANSEGIAGQQGGIPMDKMPDFIDELCNLIDWANGDPATNSWAKMRADAGHPAPFNLKYIGIGNEDIISTVFEERYEMICKAIRERHPEIKICGTVGPFHTPSADYIEGWDFTRKHPTLQYMTDEHYYESTGWFLHHRDYYDNYPRTITDTTANGMVAAVYDSPKVYLGEWAASTKTKRPNTETALAEALYLTDVERNGDIVEMTSYAPMLCKDGHSNWNPDMIYFGNTSIRTTPAYEVQRLFSTHSGDRYVKTTLTLSRPDVQHRIGASLVSDSKTGIRYLKLVNALPSTLKLNISGLDLPATVTCEQFTGRDIQDQRAKAETIVTAEPATLPPYSIRVITLDK